MVFPIPTGVENDLIGFFRSLCSGSNQELITDSYSDVRRLCQFSNEQIGWRGLAVAINQLSHIQSNGLRIDPIDLDRASTIADIINALQPEPLKEGAFWPVKGGKRRGLHKTKTTGPEGTRQFRQKVLAGSSETPQDTGLKTVRVDEVGAKINTPKPETKKSARPLGTAVFPLKEGIKLQTDVSKEDKSSSPIRYRRVGGLKVRDHSRYFIEPGSLDDFIGVGASETKHASNIASSSDNAHTPGTATRSTDWSAANTDAWDDRQTEIRLVDPATDREWGAMRPVVVGKPSAIEIAIKPPAEVGGLEAPEGRQSVKMRSMPGPVDLLIKVVDASSEGVRLQIDEPFRALTLPPSGASTPQRVTFTPLLSGQPDGPIPAVRRGRLTVQIFYRLNLIDAIDVSLAVVAQETRIDSGPAPTGPNAHFIYYRPEKEEEGRALGWLGDDIASRSMLIYVTTTDRKIDLDFTVARDAAHELRLSATSFVSREELSKLLIEVREALTRLIIDTFGGQVDGDDQVYGAALDKLARLGRRAWILLFNNVSASESLAVVSNYLKALNLPDGSIIQIVLRDTISDFVFPWSILYDGEDPNAEHPAEWRHFWGARYQIEQYVGRSDSARPLLPKDIDFAFLPWDSFAEAELVWKTLSKMVSPPHIESIGKYRTPIALVNAIKSDRVNFYCFFCHGHTRSSQDLGFANLIRRQLQIIKAKEEALAEAADGKPPDARRIALTQFVTSMKALMNSSLSANDDAIELSDGTVNYQELIASVGTTRMQTQPVFFLDMCQSAQLFPGMSESFVGLFLKLKAATVIGTECEISPALGHAFAEVFLDSMFLKGRTAGEALLDARGALARRRNPLGLVYTLYGRATRALVPKTA
jgi:hypothetical protein